MAADAGKPRPAFLREDRAHGGTGSPMVVETIGDGNFPPDTMIGIERARDRSALSVVRATAPAVGAGAFGMRKRARVCGMKKKCTQQCGNKFPVTLASHSRLRPIQRVFETHRQSHWKGRHFPG